MKKILFGLLTMGLGLWPVASWADSDNGGHDKSFDEVIQNIAEAQEVSDYSEIDCNQVTDEQLDELGDAVMSVMVGDGKQHELMDNMMGGEGSDSLSAMHINMGRRNLGCVDGASGMGMMGGGMRQTSAMMGNMFGLGDAMVFGGAGMLTFWVLFIFVVGLFVFWLNRKQGAVGSVTALDILKNRYAKGEIEKKEFERKKKELIS